jgi:hypothetical protein
MTWFARSWRPDNFLSLGARGSRDRLGGLLDLAEHLFCWNELLELLLLAMHAALGKVSWTVAPSCSVLFTTTALPSWEILGGPLTLPVITRCAGALAFALGAMAAEWLSLLALRDFLRGPPRNVSDTCRPSERRAAAGP